MLPVALARRIDDIQRGRWTANDTIGYAFSASSNDIDPAPVRYPDRRGPSMDNADREKMGRNRMAGRGERDRGKTHGDSIVATRASSILITQPGWSLSQRPSSRCFSADDGALNPTRCQRFVNDTAANGCLRGSTGVLTGMVN